MGEIPTYEYDPGDPCPRCFGIGKTFGEVNPPERVLATFTGITTCPGVIANPNQSWLLEQTVPCIYRNPIGADLVQFAFSRLSFGIWVAEAYMYLWPWPALMFTGQAAECSVIISSSNDVADCVGLLVSGFGGLCEISWGPEI